MVLCLKTWESRPLPGLRRAEVPLFDTSLERFPIAWNHAIEKESLNIDKLEQVLIEKVCQLF